METQEDRLRRMQRERGSMVIGPQGAGFPSMSWGAPPEAPRDTEVAQVTWDEKPRPSGVVQSSWSNNTPESLAAEITKPKPVIARRNKDGSPNYNVPNSGAPTPVEDLAFAERVRGGVDYVTGGDSIRNQLAYLRDVQSGARGVDAPTSHHGLAAPSPQVAAAEAVEEPKPAVVARPVASSQGTLGAALRDFNEKRDEEVRKFHEDRQAKEAVAERPVMAPQDPKAAVQAEQVPMPAKPMMNPQQRMLAGKGEWRNIASQPTLAKHYQAAAKQLGLGPMGSIAFGKLSPEQVNELRTTAHDLQREASGAQFDDRLSDRNQAKSENIPIALATAQRLQGRGNALIAEAAGLHEADPDKAAKHAAGTALLTQGNTKSADFWRAWQQQADAHRERQVMQAGMMYGREGAGIVEAHIRGQQNIQQQHLVNAGQRDDRAAAEAGLDRRANNRADVDLALADKNITAQEIQQQRDREQRINELKERERLHGLDQAQREKLAKLEVDAANHRQKIQIAADANRDAEKARLNPPPMQPAQQRAQLWEPLKAADSNPDDATPVQQYVDDFMQTLASQEGLQPQQREIQRGQAKAWANQHVMSRWENDRLRDSDRGYIRSLVYATDAEGNNTGKLKNRSTFVREMGSHYKGSNWASMAAKLGAFYDRLQKEEQESANLTQVGIPDNPVV